MGDIKRYAFSRKPPRKVLPGFEFVKEPVKDFAKSLRAKKGKNIWMMGGGAMIASFLDAGEIDEFMIHVLPVFIGEGIPLIAAHPRTVRLKLLATKKFPDGVVLMHYAVSEAQPSGSAPRAKRQP